jgi:hypothetical protein
MTYTGHIKNGTIVLDGTPNLPEGARVVIETIPADQQLPSEPNSLSALLLKFAGTVKDMPSDFARNHDHYIHGQPKK